MKKRLNAGLFTTLPPASLRRLGDGVLAASSFMSHYQRRMIIAVAKTKDRLRLAGINDNRIRAIVEEAGKKAVSSFRPFLWWLDALVTEELHKKLEPCKVNSNSQ